jgi:catechol 2,3-dioxygenase-like lactoylglutathione lyase family enzyme
MDTRVAAAPHAPGAARAGGVRLGTVPVFVADQERALRFWRDTLGFEVTLDLPIGGGARWLAVTPAPAGPELLLYRPGMYGEDAAELAGRVGVWTGIVFLTDHIGDVHARWHARGVRFAGEPSRQPWGGWEASFADPDGNRFQLAQRPTGLGGG